MAFFINLAARFIWWRMQKVSELGGRLIYQAYLVHLMRECSDPKGVEKEIWNTGYDIGIKLYNEFFSRKFKLPEKLLDLKKYGKPTWKIFTGDWPEKVIYREDQNLFILQVKDSIFCRDLKLPEDFKFHVCEIAGGIYTASLNLWLNEKKLPYTLDAHETKCKMCDDDYCEIQLKFKKK